MHVFIDTQSSLRIPNSILDATVLNIITTCNANADISIVLVGDQFSINIQLLQELFPLVELLPFSEAINTIKNVHKAAIIHFGTPIKWPATHSIYFFPLTTPSEITGLHFFSKLILKNKFATWLKSATQIVSTHEWGLSVVQKNFPPFADTIKLSALSNSPVTQMEWAQLAAAKDGLTNGNNYFLCFAPLERLVAIVKEFSLFKKWQQTTMNLVFILENEQQVQKAMELLQGYKFKQDIVVQTQDALTLDWIAASYAVLWEGVHFSKFTWMQSAIQYDVPLLLDEQLSIPQHWKEAGEVFLFSAPTALSNHFKLYYKDELYRQSRARIGKRWLESLNESMRNHELFNKTVFSHIK